jgi:acetyltransferase-like isoleucine patch superfamily enzyme
MVGAGAKVGAGAVVAGVKVGADAVVAAGECVEDDVPDGAVWMGGRVREMEGETWE